MLRKKPSTSIILSQFFMTYLTYLFHYLLFYCALNSTGKKFFFGKTGTHWLNYLGCFLYLYRVVKDVKQNEITSRKLWWSTFKIKNIPDKLFSCLNEILKLPCLLEINFFFFFANSLINIVNFIGRRML